MDRGLLMKKTDVCPWQAGPFLMMSLRGFLHNPKKITGNYLSNGMTVLDIGCGMGYFSIPMAELVGNNGKIVAVDFQSGMLDGLMRNSAKAGLSNIVAHHCEKNTLALDEWAGKVDFALIFWMLHEVPDCHRLTLEVRAAMSEHGVLLYSESKLGHVSAGQFNKSLTMITSAGFNVKASPKVALGRAALLEKG